MNTEQLHTNFTVVSISYEKANADIRGKFSFFSNQVFPLCKNVQEKKLGKFFVISTCNRTEIYCYSDDYTKIIHEYCNVIQVNYSEFITYCDVYKSGEAVKHLFRVSGGLESQILGDFEIISQVRTWYKRFQKLGSTNFYLERVVNTAIQISKKIKTHTSLSSGITSVSYATVHYLLNEVQNLQDKKILIIGIGKIGRNTSENLIKHISENQVTLMNRTNEKAIAIAEKLGIQTRKYEELQKQVNQSDVIIVATSAPNPIVT
ncbi:MAG: NAD(P)-binding domain-containing protein, partial [Flavobacteriales bacterium]|nr:NAD(P)-binding domain-containing protein [Flavobacteriales bacterium]